MKKRRIRFYVYNTPMDMSFVMWGGGNPGHDSVIAKYTGPGASKRARAELQRITKKTV
jgi:hypothetical protein